jgi:dihydrofolate reductase
MASLVLKMSVSLDGFVAPRDGGDDEDWAAAGRSDDGATWVAATVGGARVQLVGATTYAAWARYWPGAPGPVAAAMNDVPRVVFSTSLASADWPGTTIARGDLAGVVGRLTSEHGEGYLPAQGGVRFARSLVAAGLVDEYRLVVHPVVPGAGEPPVAAPRVAPSGPSGTGAES